MKKFEISIKATIEASCVVTAIDKFRDKVLYITKPDAYGLSDYKVKQIKERKNK